ncbi:DUF190 domain-containing protein [Streptomyces sp. 130]|uniref:DUF190 domain-containing protein n=1 Tax=Streptomyces sp. 130 TaxID=2591006 RepID=UPI0011805290|nr:DUF190 domain-containing protein [Streptomyces sp. 130]TRV74659.1 DUF190 domain-containing protein [Streptomyces sp. 130]
MTTPVTGPGPRLTGPGGAGVLRDTGGRGASAVIRTRRLPSRGEDRPAAAVIVDAEGSVRALLPEAAGLTGGGPGTPAARTLARSPGTQGDAE